MNASYNNIRHGTVNYLHTVNNITVFKEKFLKIRLGILQSSFIKTVFT